MYSQLLETKLDNIFMKSFKCMLIHTHTPHMTVMLIYTCIIIVLYNVYVHTHATSRDLVISPLSLSTMWVLGTQLKLEGLCIKHLLSYLTSLIATHFVE